MLLPSTLSTVVTEGLEYLCTERCAFLSNVCTSRRDPSISYVWKERPVCLLGWSCHALAISVTPVPARAFSCSCSCSVNVRYFLLHVSCCFFFMEQMLRAPVRFDQRCLDMHRSACTQHARTRLLITSTRALCISRLLFLVSFIAPRRCIRCSLSSDLA